MQPPRFSSKNTPMIPTMIDLARFLERAAFHLPFSHTWIAERDALRTENNRMRAVNERQVRELEDARRELKAAKDHLAALWQPPGHFYSPIPDVAELQATWAMAFRFPESIPDVDINVAGQLELLNQFRDWYAEQPFTAEKVAGRRFYFNNENFSYTDAIVLYFMMRRLRPRRIVEVGSGFSSCAMMDVNDLLFDGKIEFTFVEPYPDRLLRLINDRDRTRVCTEKVQDVDLQLFRDLGPNDILFIDSSHVSKTGSDLNHLLFKVLPLLSDGVQIHFHDIFWPFEYPEAWVFEGRAWNEVYLLHALLAHNRNYQVQLFNSYLIHNYRKRIEAEFPLFLKSPGGSIWIQKTEAGA